MIFRCVKVENVLVQAVYTTVGEDEAEVLVRFGKCKALFFVPWILHVAETH